ncbi:uncharacterized protein LA080_000003 [Diaporthe eres]|nr:uncharacterized protein LA080_000003 [Diaporthe eres]
MKQLRGANDSPSTAWRSIVSTYSCAALTKAEDKIIALGGIAEAMQENLADHPCIAPTWSWLSTSGGATVTTIEGTAKEYRAVSTVVAVNVDLVDPNYSTDSIFPGALLQLRGRLKAATWNLVPGYGATDFRKYQVTGDGLRSSEESQDFNLNFVTKVDISPGLELTFLKIFLLPIAIFDGTRGSTVRGLILTPTTEEADIYERVTHFTFTGERASYFFVEISTESQQGMGSRDMSGAGVLDPDGLVEGFPFDGGMEWVRIKEKDIIFV